MPSPATPARLVADIEPLAGYVAANSCDPHAKPGVIRLGNLLKATYPTTSYGTDRTCGTDPLPTSEHYDGRALDWFTSVHDPVGKARANAVIDWLFATDAAGNQYANARRLGVMYVIWNGRIWGSYRASEGWRPYSSCLATMKSAAYDTTCHRDHVHVSLSWEGAMARTSFWGNEAAARDYGPCRPADLNWASPYRHPQPTPCPDYPTLRARAKARPLHKTLVTYSGMTLRGGDTGPVVEAVQRALHTAPSGVLGASTRATIRTWRHRHHLPAHGVVNAALWRSLLHPGDLR